MKKHLLVALGITIGVFASASIALAAPTSTIVQNLIVTGVTNAPCLTTNGVGLIGSTACGGAASGTFTNVYGTTPIVVATGTASATVSCPSCVTTSSGAGLYYPLSSNPAGYVTSTTGGSTSVTSTQIAFGNASNTIVGSSTFTTLSYDTIEYADQFAGADMGAKINAAYAALPAGGGEIFVPAGKWVYTTPIVFNTSAKLAQLYCASGGGFYNDTGTVLNFATTTGVAFTNNTNGYVSGGYGITNCNFIGPAGSGNIGSSTISSTIAIKLDGTGSIGNTSAFGFTMRGVHISGFGTGLYIGQNASFVIFDAGVINKNGREIDSPNVGGANGENLRVTNSVIADSNSPSGSIANRCVELDYTGTQDWQFTNDSFDDCQVYIGASGGTESAIHFTNNHWENPNYAGTGCYDYIAEPSGQIADDSVTSVGNLYVFAGGASCTDIVSNGGAFSSYGDTVSAYSSLSTTTVRFVTNQDTADTLTWDGFAVRGLSGGSQTTYIYGNIPVTPQGFGAGTATPAYTISTSTLGVFTFGTNPTDPSGNKYVTSTSGGGLSGLTANYLPVALSSTTATSSVVFQNALGTATGTPTLVNSSVIGNNAAATSASTTVNVSANNLLIVSCTHGTTFVAPTNVTDTIGNTFTQFAIASNTSQGSITGYYAISSSANASDVISCNFASSVGGRVILTAQYSGIATVSPLDTTATNSTSSVATTFSAGPYTTAQASELIISAAAGAAGSQTIIASSSATMIASTTVGATGVTGMQARIVSAIQTSVSSTFTSTSTGSAWSMIVGTFKASAATGPNNFIGVSTTIPSTLLDVNGDITDENVKSAPFIGTNATGTLIAVPTSTLKSYTDTFGYATSTTGASSTNIYANYPLTVATGTASATLSLFTTASTTFFIDNARTDTYTSNGSLMLPFKTISGAIASSTGNGCFAYYIAPGTYVDGAPDTMPSCVFIMGNQSTYIPASGVTFPGAFDIYDLTIAGNVTEAATSTNSIHQFQNGVITGSLSMAGNGLLNNMAMPTVTSTITIKAGSLTNIAGSFIQSNIINAGTANLNDDELLVTATNTTGFAYYSSSTGAQTIINGLTLIVTNPLTQGMYTANGATSSANILANLSIVVNTSTAGSTLTAGTAATVITGANQFTNQVGTFIAPSGTVWSASFDATRFVLNGFSVGTSTVTNNQTTFTTPVQVNGQITEPFATSSATTPTTTINWALSNKQWVQMNVATTSFAFSNVTNGASYTLWVLQNATGSETVAWPSTGTGRINWASSTAPTLSTGANAMDAFSFQCFTPATTSTLSCYGQYGANNFIQ